MCRAVIQIFEICSKLSTVGTVLLCGHGVTHKSIF